MKESNDYLMFQSTDKRIVLDDFNKKYGGTPQASRMSNMQMRQSKDLLKVI